MRILITSWEFPPYKVGGIASHTYDLSRNLIKAGHDVHVLTCADRDFNEIIDGVNVHRLSSTCAPDTISWAMFLSHRMEKAAIELHKQQKFELVHAHDWMMVPGGVGIKKMLKIPMVFTLHSSEHGRSGVHNAYTKMINDLEWYGTYEAAQVITVGRDFCDEVKNRFSVPGDKINYIPNGVDVSRFKDVKFFIDRNNYAADWEKLVLFVGRLSHQKGVEYLLQAAPEIIRRHPETKFVITGRGNDDLYKEMAHGLGLWNKVFFTGYVDENYLPAIYSISDVVAAPSVYEPFGIVALESSASGKPIVGSYTGGLKDTIIHEWSGLHTYPCHTQSIVDQVDRILDDDSWARWMGENGRWFVKEEYNWKKITSWTVGTYGKAMGMW